VSFATSHLLIAAQFSIEQLSSKQLRHRLAPLSERRRHAGPASLKILACGSLASAVPIWSAWWDGRGRIYLDRFWNDFSLDPKRFDEAKRQHYAALYAMPGAIRAGFAQFAAFAQDAIDNKAYLAKGKLTMPVLAIGGEASFGTMMAKVMRIVATDVQEAMVPDSGHWIMEENPSATIKLVTEFLKSKL